MFDILRAEYFVLNVAALMLSLIFPAALPVIGSTCGFPVYIAYGLPAAT